MPRTLQYRPVLIDGLISNERINSYQTVFHPRDDVELVGAYLWNSHVCGVLYPLISAVEITLRNAIDQSFVADLGRFWWSEGKLRYRSFGSRTDIPHVVQAVRDNFARATRSHAADLRRRHVVRRDITPQHHGVIAKTEFSTWEFLLHVEFLGRGLIWPKHLSSVFQGKWPGHQAGPVLGHIRDLVATLRDFRNRLFHHEPARKRYGVRTESDALLHLNEKIGKVESLLGLIHPDNLRLLQVNGLLRDAYRACSAAEIRRFQHAARVFQVRSLDELGAWADQCSIENRVMEVTLRHAPGPRFLIVPR